VRREMALRIDLTEVSGKVLRQDPLAQLG
jgi:hypothetical protein